MPNCSSFTAYKTHAQNKIFKNDKIILLFLSEIPHEAFGMVTFFFPQNYFTGSTGEIPML